MYNKYKNDLLSIIHLHDLESDLKKFELTLNHLNVVKYENGYYFKNKLITNDIVNTLVNDWINIKKQR